MLRRTLLLMAVACADTQVVESFPDEFAGVGLELKIIDGWPEVIAPLPGGPAAVAGVQKADRIAAINGKSTENLTLGQVVVMLRGKPDSQVNLDLVRAKQRMIVVVRRQVMKKQGEKYKALK
jgi:carboxyl-terminal processing protease